jgi:hypothetical protein
MIYLTLKQLIALIAMEIPYERKGEWVGYLNTMVNSKTREEIAYTLPTGAKLVRRGVGYSDQWHYNRKCPYVIYGYGYTDKDINQYKKYGKCNF